MNSENLLSIPRPRLGQIQRLPRKAPKCREDKDLMRMLGSPS